MIVKLKHIKFKKLCRMTLVFEITITKELTFFNVFFLKIS